MESALEGRPGDRAAEIVAPRPIERPFNLLCWFSTVSLVAIIIVGSVVGWILTRYLTTQMLLRDAEVTREFLESIAATEMTRDYLRPDAPPPPAKALDLFVEHIPTFPDLVRANLYAYDRTLLWSTDSQLVGQKFEDNDELERAFTGEIVISISRSILVSRRRLPQPGSITSWRLMSRFATRAAKRFLPSSRSTGFRAPFLPLSTRVFSWSG